MSSTPPGPATSTNAPAEDADSSADASAEQEGTHGSVVSVPVEAADGPPPGPTFISRVAVALLRVPKEVREEDGQEVEKRIRAALTADPRVEKVDEPRPSMVRNVSITEFLPLDVPEEESRVPGSIEPGFVQALRLNTFIRFRVRVPIKNQPRYRGVDDVPSEVYEVAWDGVCLVVQWSQSDPRATMSGGHIVLEIAEEVVAKAGYELFIQACTNGCEHRFMHADVVTFPGDHSEDEADGYHTHGEVGVVRSVHAPRSSDAGVEASLLGLLSDVSYPALGFATLMNMRDYIRRTEASARVHTGRLLQLGYEKAVRPPILKPSGIADRWRRRGSRSEARGLIAVVWLELSELESLLRRWPSEYRELQTRWSRKETEVVFDPDSIDADYIEGVDLTLLRSSLEESASRLDSNVLTVATAASALGAIAGGIAGGLVG